LAATADALRGLGTVIHAEELVGGAQVLLHSGLREVEAVSYLGIAQAVYHKFKDFLLAWSKNVRVYGIFLGQQVLKQLSRGNHLTLRSHLDGTGYLGW
jgi:hypothetical protein